MVDRPIASDLSYQVLQRRHRRGELVTPQLNETNRRRYPLMGARRRERDGAVGREWVTGEREPVRNDVGDRARARLGALPLTGQGRSNGEGSRERAQRIERQMARREA